MEDKIIKKIVYYRDDPTSKYYVIYDDGTYEYADQGTPEDAERFKDIQAMWADQGKNAIVNKVRRPEDLHLYLGDDISNYNIGNDENSYEIDAPEEGKGLKTAGVLLGATALGVGAGAATYALLNKDKVEEVDTRSITEPIPTDELVLINPDEDKVEEQDDDLELRLAQERVDEYYRYKDVQKSVMENSKIFIEDFNGLNESLGINKYDKDGNVIVSNDISFNEYLAAYIYYNDLTEEQIADIIPMFDHEVDGSYFLTEEQLEEYKDSFMQKWFILSSEIKDSKDAHIFDSLIRKTYGMSSELSEEENEKILTKYQDIFAKGVQYMIDINNGKKVEKQNVIDYLINLEKGYEEEDSIGNDSVLKAAAFDLLWTELAYRYSGLDDYEVGINNIEGKSEKETLSRLMVIMSQEGCGHRANIPDAIAMAKDAKLKVLDDIELITGVRYNSTINEYADAHYDDEDAELTYYEKDANLVRQKDIEKEVRLWQQLTDEQKTSLYNHVGDRIKAITGVDVNSTDVNKNVNSKVNTSKSNGKQTSTTTTTTVAANDVISRTQTGTGVVKEEGQKQLNQIAAEEKAKDKDVFNEKTGEEYKHTTTVESDGSVTVKEETYGKTEYNSDIVGKDGKPKVDGNIDYYDNEGNKTHTVDNGSAPAIDENKAIAEEAKKAAEEAKKAEEARKAEEEARRKAAEEEAKKAEEEAKKAEEENKKKAEADAISKEFNDLISSYGYVYNGTRTVSFEEYKTLSQTDRNNIKAATQKKFNDDKAAEERDRQEAERIAKENKLRDDYNRLANTYGGFLTVDIDSYLKMSDADRAQVEQNAIANRDEYNRQQALIDEQNRQIAIENAIAARWDNLVANYNGFIDIDYETYRAKTDAGRDEYDAYVKNKKAEWERANAEIEAENARRAEEERRRAEEDARYNELANRYNELIKDPNFNMSFEEFVANGGNYQPRVVEEQAPAAPVVEETPVQTENNVETSAGDVVYTIESDPTTQDIMSEIQEENVSNREVVDESLMLYTDVNDNGDVVGVYSDGSTEVLESYSDDISYDDVQEAFDDDFGGDTITYDENVESIDEGYQYTYSN